MYYPSEIPEPKNPSKVVQEHIQLERFVQLVDYPSHGCRAVKQFNELTEERVVKGNQGCFICGVTAEDIRTKPQFKACGDIQLHHCLAQFALENGVDVDKWNNTVIPLFNEGIIWNPNKLKLTAPMSAKQIHDFVNFGNANMLPLCQKHHRGKYTGIHNLTYPIWISQKFLKSQHLPENQKIYAQYLEEKSNKFSKHAPHPQAHSTHPHTYPGHPYPHK